MKSVFKFFTAIFAAFIVFGKQTIKVSSLQTFVMNYLQDYIWITNYKVWLAQQHVKT